MLHDSQDAAVSTRHGNPDAASREHAAFPFLSRLEEEPGTLRVKEVADIVGSGSDAGQGANAHRRSDERISEDVHRALSDESMLDPRTIDVTVADGVVTLTGSVQSAVDKRLAEAVLDDVRGISDVHNQIEVLRPV